MCAGGTQDGPGSRILAEEEETTWNQITEEKDNKDPSRPHDIIRVGIRVIPVVSPD